MFFFVSLYVQEILGYSPLHAGLAFLPVTVGIAVGAGLAQQLIRRFGIATSASSGSRWPRQAWWSLRGFRSTAPTSATCCRPVPMSFGMGLDFVPITLLATGGVTANDSGLASGLFNTSQQVGGALGLAILSTLAASKTTSVLNGLHGATTAAANAAARVSGYHVAFLAAAVMLGAGGLILGFGLRRRHLEGLSLEELTPSAVAA